MRRDGWDLGVQGGKHGKGKRVNSRQSWRMGRGSRKPTPVLHFPSALCHLLPPPGPLPIRGTTHSPTISAPTNRLRRTLTNQNQRCGNRYQVRPGYCSTRVPRISLDSRSPRSLVPLQLPSAPYAFPSYISDILRFKSGLHFVHVPLSHWHFCLLALSSCLPGPIPSPPCNWVVCLVLSHHLHSTSYLASGSGSLSCSSHHYGEAQ